MIGKFEMQEEVKWLYLTVIKWAFLAMIKVAFCAFFLYGSFGKTDPCIPQLN